MHELAITQNMLDVVLEQASKEGAGDIKRINLVVGELTGIVEQCVQFYFNFYAKDTIAEKAEVVFNRVPPTARCGDCGNEVNVDKEGWKCPVCGGEDMELIKGRELYIESIEVD